MPAEVVSEHRANRIVIDIAAAIARGAGEAQIRLQRLAGGDWQHVGQVGQVLAVEVVDEPLPRHLELAK